MFLILNVKKCKTKEVDCNFCDKNKKSITFSLKLSNAKMQMDK